MQGTIIEQQIRRCNRNLLLVNAGLIGLCLLSVVLAQRYFYNCVAGPFPVSADEFIAMMSTSGNRNYIAVTDDLDATDTGVSQSHSISFIPTGTDHFLAAPLGGRLLLIKSSDKEPQKHYQGGISTIPSDIRGLLEGDLREEGQRFNELFLPLMLDATSYRSDAYLFFLFGLPVLGLSLWNVKKALLRIEDYKQSPIYATICRYGGNPAEIAATLDAEASSNGVVRRGNFILTPSWLLHKTFFRFTPFHLDEIIWMYGKQTTTYYYGFIPMGKSHSLVIADAAGRTAESRLSRIKQKKRVEEFLTLLSARIPWAITGYSEELKAAYEKELSGFVAAVEERRRKHHQTKVVD